MPESVRKGVRLDIINGFRGVNAAYNHVETRQLELVTALKESTGTRLPAQRERIFSTDEFDQLLPATGWQNQP
jgi:hypothetical protein